jgi:hypothetical protein
MVNTSAITVRLGGPAVPIIGSVGNYTLGFNSTITWTMTGFPPGLNYAYQTGNAANNFVNITYGISATSATAPGTYPITIRVSGGGATYSAILNVTVAPAAQTTAKH